jgi:Flp pilus assembly pilin Flp
MKALKTKYRLLKGMSIIEYALLVAVVCVALLGMSPYLKRSVYGKWKQSIDLFGHGRQYDPLVSSGGGSGGSGGGGNVTPPAVVSPYQIVFTPPLIGGDFLQTNIPNPGLGTTYSATQFTTKNIYYWSDSVLYYQKGGTGAPILLISVVGETIDYTDAYRQLAASSLLPFTEFSVKLKP